MASSLPQSGVPERFSTGIGSGLTRKHIPRQEKLAMDNHSSLLQKFVYYGMKKFYNIDPPAKVIKLFVRNLRMLVIS